MQEQEQLNPEDLQVSKTTTTPESDVVNATAPEEIIPEDLDKKNYLKVSPTFYIKAVESEDDEEELFKILNPETSEVEIRELTDEEKKEIYLLELKRSRKVFNPIKHDGNVTTNQFNAKYKQKRRRRNKLTKASRKNNR